MEELRKNIQQYLEDIERLQNELNRVVNELSTRSFNDKINILHDLIGIAITDLMSWLNWFRVKPIEFDESDEYYLTLLLSRLIDFLHDLFKLDKEYCKLVLKKIK